MYRAVGRVADSLLHQFLHVANSWLTVDHIFEIIEDGWLKFKTFPHIVTILYYVT